MTSAAKNLKKTGRSSNRAALSTGSRRSSDGADQKYLVQARHISGHRVWVRFNDGVEGEVDLRQRLRGEIFRPLLDPAFFSRFTVDDTLIWPNGADFAPETLYELVLQAGIKK